MITPGIFFLIFYGQILHVLFVRVLRITSFAKTQHLSASKYRVNCSYGTIEGTLQYLSQSLSSLVFPILIYTNTIFPLLSGEIDTAVLQLEFNLLTALSVTGPTSAPPEAAELM